MLLYDNTPMFLSISNHSSGRGLRWRPLTFNIGTSSCLLSRGKLDDLSFFISTEFKNSRMNFVEFSKRKIVVSTTNMADTCVFCFSHLTFYHITSSIGKGLIHRYEKNSSSSCLSSIFKMLILREKNHNELSEHDSTNGAKFQIYCFHL